MREDARKIVMSPRHTPSLELGLRPSLTLLLPSYACCLWEPQSSSLYSGSSIPLLPTLGEIRVQAYSSPSPSCVQKMGGTPGSGWLL